MSWNGSGGFDRTQDFTADLAAGLPASIVSADKVDDEFDNFKAGLQNCLTRDGQNSPTTDISWNGKKLTSLAAPASGTDAANKAYVDAGAYLGTTITALTTGTVDALDYVVIADVSDSNSPKKVTVQSIVALSAEQTDSTFRIVGSVDATKKLAFEVDGNTTGTTRTATFPDADITVVGTTTAQTLSNKTFTQTIAVTGTSSGPATITLGEDTDNGANTVTVAAPASLAADVVSTLPATTGTLANRSKYAYLSYEVAAGSGGGTATADAWTTRAINTETDPDNIVTLSSNTFTVAETGTYKLGAVMMFFSDATRVGICKARIQNTTDATTVLRSLTGGLGFPSGTSGNVPCQIPDEVVTLTTGKTYALQYYCDYTGSAGDLGYAYANAASGLAEVYAKISIEKIS